MGELLTIRATAERLGRSRYYVTALIGDKLLVTIARPGGRRYITAASLDAWLASGEPDPKPPAKFYVCPEIVKTRGRTP